VLPRETIIHRLGGVAVVERIHSGQSTETVRDHIRTGGLR
jgi:hypothetical protein